MTLHSEQYKPQAWRMTDYYPDSYAKFMAALGVGIDYDDADFDRYHAEFMADLAEHDRQVAERAWEEGVRVGYEEGRRDEKFSLAYAPPENSPHRASKGEQK